MMEKFKNCDFGRCPRVYCNGQVGRPLHGRACAACTGNLRQAAPRCWHTSWRGMPARRTSAAVRRSTVKSRRRSPTVTLHAAAPVAHRHLQACLPVGLSDIPRQSTVKLFCPKCEDVYYPRSKYHGNLDGGCRLPGQNGLSWQQGGPGSFATRPHAAASMRRRRRCAEAPKGS